MSARSLGGARDRERAARPAQVCRLVICRLYGVVLLGAPFFGWSTSAPAGEQVRGPATPVVPAEAGARSAVRRALREFDSFLDHHPLLEDQLRLEPRLATENAFLELNPDLRDFLRANPEVGEGLRLFPRYLLNRALRRQANGPLSFADLAALKPLFLEQPELEQALTRNPESIRDPAFLRSHAALHNCLAQHPALARVFLRPAISLQSN